MQDAVQHPPSMATPAQPDPVALFISDLHLQASHPHTTAAFLEFLKRHALHAQQLYLLGDLFEYWAGDDDLNAPHINIVIQAIRQVSDAGVSIFWIAGNRDFLVGEGFSEATGATILPDPFVATIAGRQIVLTHGDALCTDDVAYIAFRNQVRQPAWQQQFLAQPLSQRKAIIDGMRTVSRAAQQSKSMEIMDVNVTAVATMFRTSGTSLMIHGHTHRPARHECHDNDGVQVRYVLPAWECDSEPARGGWIALGLDGAIKRFTLDGIELA